MQPDRAVDRIDVTNSGSDPVIVQAEVFAWSQRNGESVYQATREIIVSPPVFEVTPRGQQILRLAYTGDSDLTEEKQYRLYLTEVPTDPEVMSGPSLKVALRLGIPVFVTPDDARPDVSYRIENSCDAKPALVAINHGTAHDVVRAGRIVVNGSASETLPGFSYILPGGEITWEIEKLRFEPGDTVELYSRDLRNNERVIALNNVAGCQ